MLAEAFWTARENARGQNRHGGDHGEPDEAGREGKSAPADERHPQGREDHPADAGAVVGHAEGRRPLRDEPGGHDGIDGGSTQSRPAGARQERCAIELPGGLGQGPAQHAEAQENRPRHRDPGQAEAPVQGRHVGDHEHAGEKVEGDGARHQRHGPAPRRAHGFEIDRGSIEADAPAEGGDHESGRDDAPAMEGCGNGRGGKGNGHEP
jgi:hypothetical protein